MTTQMIIKINSEQKNKLTRLARSEGKTNSQVLREIINKYIKEHDMNSYAENLWSKISNRINENGFNQKDVNKVIRESRAGKK
jgi:predicted DNA-binding protein